ncbi:probable protein phosphatase 2C 38 [Mercurialis annua]|uniref:probable protein phosphatase 2C 38 n=1 Tax=Mercurialis annua TaxID=3986 RepID=UPI00215FF15A|nr:probable protein phosphatase 2C 38 [Mercurialis annua]XP_050227387.1 probable protein phosphatase 2C 38 [Mercurialis annua]XP_050227388.1 probable protein phosphatase 2C 38 [Mercurialis annua]
MVKPCWRARVDDDGSGKVDGLLWYKELGHHVHGEFSMAVIQANSSLEDQTQLESGSLSSTNSGPLGTFVGVYDGHGGNEASKFINHNLLQNFKAIVSEHQEVSETVIKKAFAATDEDFLCLVKKQWLSKPQMASVGSCCLVGVICDGMLYVANAGDSRAVLGRTVRGGRGVTAIQLSQEHNANLEIVRNELWSLHPDDPQIVVMKHKVWRVKGIIQVSRSIGDAYLKKAQFNKEPLQSKFRVQEPFDKPILSSEPSVSVHKLQPEDQFLIFASDGLWEQLSNQEAVDIVQNFPRNGIAKRLVKAALMEAARKREMRYADLQKIDQGVRRHFHDDITAVVVFIDSHVISGRPFGSFPVSIRGRTNS